MNYQQLCRSGLRVSRLLGAMLCGRATDETFAARMTGKARDSGNNFIDTADSAAKGTSALFVGRAISGSRHDGVLATHLLTAEKEALIDRLVVPGHYDPAYQIEGRRARTARA